MASHVPSGYEFCWQEGDLPLLTRCLSYIISFDTWHIICSLSQGYRTLVQTCPHLWENSSIRISGFVIPNVLWSRFHQLFRSARCLIIDVQQLRRASHIPLPLWLEWSWLPQVEGIPLLLSDGLFTPGIKAHVNFNWKLYPLGVLDGLTVGFTSVRNILSLHDHLSNRRWDGMYFFCYGACISFPTPHRASFVRCDGWVLNGRFHEIYAEYIQSPQNRDSGRGEITLTMAWDTDIVEIWINGSFVSAMNLSEADRIPSNQHLSFYAELSFRGTIDLTASVFSCFLPRC